MVGLLDNLGCRDNLSRMTVYRLLLGVAVLACSNERARDASADSAQQTRTADVVSADTAQEPEPTQWTVREVAKRLTDGGLVVTDSGRTRLRQPFLSVEGHLMRVSGSDLQVFIYADARARSRDSDRLHPDRVAPSDAIIDWVAPPHLIASGNLIAIHLTPNERLAERVRLILEAWHAEP